ncbi:MAG TPA: zinc metallopeptidase [Verrucomicrobiae bacterium]
MDPIFWLLLLPGILLGLYAQMRLSSTYKKYVRQGIATGTTGAQAAREILDRAGLHNMPVNMVRGHLTDHYDPLKKALFLSEENYHGRSIAAVGVAAHEAGHALQHQAAYAPLQLRMAMVPITNFATQATMFLIFGQIFLGIANLALLGVIIYGVVAAFQLITLPVEYDASRRAKQQLLAMGIVQRDEAPAVSKVLNAAALTYVAAMVTSLAYLIYWLAILRGNSRD